MTDDTQRAGRALRQSFRELNQLREANQELTIKNLHEVIRKQHATIRKLMDNRRQPVAYRVRLAGDDPEEWVLMHPKQAVNYLGRSAYECQALYKEPNHD